MKRILLVDDEPDFVELLKGRLEANEYQVIAAHSAKEALDILERIKPDKFDAVLLDILMPVMNGIETLKIIRSMDNGLPVFMLTASADNKQQAEAAQLGAAGYIVKTSDLQKEINNINSFLKSHKYRRLPEGESGS